MYDAAGLMNTGLLQAARIGCQPHFYAAGCDLQGVVVERYNDSLLRVTGTRTRKPSLGTGTAALMSKSASCRFAIESCAVHTMTVSSLTRVADLTGPVQSQADTVTLFPAMQRARQHAHPYSSCSDNKEYTKYQVRQSCQTITSGQAASDHVAHSHR